MKVINKPIDAIVYFNIKGEIRPMKFKISSEDGEEIVKVDRLIGRKTEKVAAKTYETFRCQSIIDNIEKIYELRYDREKFTWILNKM